MEERIRNKNAPQQKIYFMPQLVVNMNITLLNLIYIYTEKLEILKRHAAYLNRCKTFKTTK